MKQFHPVRHVAFALFVLIATAASQAQTSQPSHKEHDPKIWEKDIAKFEAADQDHKPEPGGVEFFGSSTIRFWNVKKAFADSPVFNRGFGGCWSADCNYYADRVVIPYQPRTIIFYAGDNDIAAGQPASEVVNSFKGFVKKVHKALPDTNIVFISIKPSPSRTKYWPTMVKANAAIKHFAEKTKNVQFADMNTEMFDADGKPRKELFRADMLHLNAKGYAIWNQKIAPYVQGNATDQKQ